MPHFEIWNFSTNRRNVIRQFFELNALNAAQELRERSTQRRGGRLRRDLKSLANNRRELKRLRIASMRVCAIESIANSFPVKRALRLILRKRSGKAGQPGRALELGKQRCHCRLTELARAW